MPIGDLAPGEGQSGWGASPLAAEEETTDESPPVWVWTDDGEEEPAAWTGDRWVWVRQRGWTRVDELTPGDEIHAGDGTAVRVLHVAKDRDAAASAAAPALAGEGR